MKKLKNEENMTYTEIEEKLSLPESVEFFTFLRARELGLDLVSLMGELNKQFEKPFRAVEVRLRGRTIWLTCTLPEMGSSYRGLFMRYDNEEWQYISI